MFCSVFCSATLLLLRFRWVRYPSGMLLGTRTFRSRSKCTLLARLKSSSCTLASWAVGCRTYSSAPLSRINCTVKAPCSPRPCSVHEICTSVTWRTLIVCSVCCSATRSPFFRAIGNSVRRLCPQGGRLNSPARSLCLRSRGAARLVEVLIVEAHSVPDGVLRLLRVGELANIHLLAFQHLVVLEEAPELSQPMLWQLAVMFVGAVLRVVEVDADYLLVVLALVDHVHHPDGTRPQDAERLDRFLHQHK